MLDRIEARLDRGGDRLWTLGVNGNREPEVMCRIRRGAELLVGEERRAPRPLRLYGRSRDLQLHVVHAVPRLLAHDAAYVLNS